MHMGGSNKKNQPNNSQTSSTKSFTIASETSTDVNYTAAATSISTEGTSTSTATSSAGSGSSDGSCVTASIGNVSITNSDSHGSASSDDSFDPNQAPFYQLMAVETLDKLKKHYVDSKWMQDLSNNPNIQTKMQLWDELLKRAKTRHPNPDSFYNELLNKIDEVQQSNKNTMKQNGDGEGNFGIFCLVAKELINSLQRFQDRSRYQQWLDNQLGNSLSEIALNNLKEHASNFFGLQAWSEQELKDDKAAFSITCLLKDYWFNKQIQQALSKVKNRFSESFWNKLNYILGDADSKQPQKMELVFERINYLLQIKQNNIDKSSEYYKEQVIGALNTAKARNDDIEAKDSTYWQRVNKWGQNCYEAFFNSEDYKQHQSLEHVLDQIIQQLDPEYNHTKSASAAP